MLTGGFARGLGRWDGGIKDKSGLVSGCGLRVENQRLKIKMQRYKVKIKKVNWVCWVCFVGGLR